jgi:hypothetical protein
LDDASGLLDDFADSDSFVHGQGKWFFAVDVLSGAAGVDEHLSVPMVGCADGYDIDILSGEEFAIVFAGKRGASERRFGLFADVSIDIAHGHDIAEVLGLVGDDGSLVSQADRSDSRTGVWAAAGQQGAA